MANGLSISEFKESGKYNRAELFIAKINGKAKDENKKPNVLFKRRDKKEFFEIEIDSITGKTLGIKNLLRLMIFLQEEVQEGFTKLKEKMTSYNTFYHWRRVYLREIKSNLCPTLTANMGTGGHNVPLIKDQDGFRKLTPEECVRFQGFPDDFKFPEEVLNGQRYKQAGNSVVVPVIKRIADEMVRVLDLKYGQP